LLFVVDFRKFGLKFSFQVRLLDRHALVMNLLWKKKWESSRCHEGLWPRVALLVPVLSGLKSPVWTCVNKKYLRAVCFANVFPASLRLRNLRELFWRSIYVKPFFSFTLRAILLHPLLPAPYFVLWIFLPTSV
jgi:hypothetical protein